MDSVKRKHDDSDNEDVDVPEKRSRFCTESPTLLDLSDDVLMYILRLLNSHDLLSLSDVCVRFDRIVADESLWKCVDTLDNPVKPAKFRKLLKYMNHKTRIIRIGGKVVNNIETITPSILENITKNCPNLEELILDKCLINAEK